MQESLNQYLVRVAIFLALIFIVIVLLYPVLQNAFLSNIFINVIILIALGVGIVFNLVKLVALNSDYFVLANFDINNSVKSFSTRNGNLKNLTSDLKQIDLNSIQNDLKSNDIMILNINYVDGAKKNEKQGYCPASLPNAHGFGCDYCIVWHYTTILSF